MVKTEGIIPDFTPKRVSAYKVGTGQYPHDLGSYESWRLRKAGAVVPMDEAPGPDTVPTQLYLPEMGGMGGKDEYAKRKAAPMFAGLLVYFPDALREVARLSLSANEKHNPGEELHWSKDKSNDHADCIVRHLADAASGSTYDPDNDCSPLVAVAWRALALLQTDIEERRKL